MKWFAPVLFFLTLLLTGCNSVTTVAYNLSEREANEIVVLLSTQGIAAQKLPAVASSTGPTAGQQLWNIAVPAKYTTDAISSLNRAGLPRTRGTSLLDLFGAQGLVPSDLQNKIRYQEGLSEQLATTIRKMDGIIDADVQITFPQDEESQIPLTASVYVKHRGVLDNPNSLMTTKIKRLVSSALPGLTLDNVSVIADRALLADLKLPETELPQEYDYVSIWGVVIAKDSILRFRLIFYVCLILLFLLAGMLVWLLWKMYPVLKAWGLRTLLHPKPYEPMPIAEKTGESQPLPEEPEIEEAAFEVKTREQ